MSLSTTILPGERTGRVPGATPRARGRGRRDGMSLLGIVLFFCLIIGIVVFATHSLWQGSSRTLFSVQEHRQLLHLARSAIAEAYFEVQRELNALGGTPTFYWFIQEPQPSDLPLDPDKTQGLARDMTNVPGTNPGNLQFWILGPDDERTEPKVTMRRVRGVPTGLERYRTHGIIDLRVSVEVERLRPRHQARLTMVERRGYRIQRVAQSPWLTSDSVVITGDPIGTWIEDEL